MAIDAGIYSQIQQPQPQNQLATLAQAYQVKGLQSQLDRADRAEQQQNRLLALVQSPEFSKMDAQGKAGALQGVGDFDNAGKVITADAAANKDRRAAEVSGLDMKIKQLDAAANIAGTVTDQASYDRALPMMRDLGFDISKFSPQYNPQGVAQFAQATLSAKERLANQTQIRGQDITMRGQDLSQQTALRGQDLSRDTSIRGQDLTDSRARDLNATRVEENRLRREAQGTGVKMTEDQGKATGWLVQAENAYKNMLAAGFDKDGNPLPAAKPGVADMIAAAPLGGPVGNWLRSPDRQKFVQGASSLSESLLRAATGAGVNKDEAKQKIEELTPIWGEDDATTKQKMAAIPLYIESLKVRAGPGASKATEIRSNAAPSGGVMKVTNAEDYAKVPSGATYTTPDGKTRRKP